jgi:anhydro-N-acetylmuramic acid kinase
VAVQRKGPDDRDRQHRRHRKRDAAAVDTGPGNTLLDAWCRQHRNEAYDDAGRWAASGTVDTDLLDALLADEYLARPAPKSTGFEHYNLAWLDSLGVDGLPPEDVQATLLEFTAQSLTDAVLREAADCRDLYLCGGGIHNPVLTGRIEELLPGVSVTSTARRGLDPDWVEAAAFAWLARERTAGRTGNLPDVTGASRLTSLGAIYRA